MNLVPYVIVGAVLLINVLLWIFWMPRYVDRRISRFQNELVDRHYAEVETMYRKMRGWRHDYHNHIQVLKAHMELGDYGDALRYLDMLNDDLTTVDTVIKTGNVMVDAILNSKLTIIREKGIQVDATAVVPQDVPFSGIDLSALIGNLLDNALEACLQMGDGEEPFIRIYIDIVKKQLYIAVTNSMSGRARRSGLQYLTTKSGGHAGVHGFGLVRIDRIVSKYGGFLNRQDEEGVFATEVMLPLVEG
ncbi:sensor histidine kinase [uncultured Acetatifactor sp.]|jgi:sensor histidine kinase regulating citrate/malate metabolism|uniref:sensor histidine kinase n=1 Tax=uncultured Acetatifactor sp. TaxID=1671927 RepID=UPI0025E395BF|nr:GHKL domain-containing protein [uncultured Acetatifactor sp.]MCI9231314.1 GHKL domain-containing protein [Lachnospiraceae bacterium]